MLSDFHPVPTIGSQYKTKNGEFILVTDVTEANGQLPDAVYYKTVPADSDKEFEALEDDWNSMELVEVSTPTPEPTPTPNSSPNPAPSPTPNPVPQPEPNPTSEDTPVSSDGIYSSDPLINELAKLLEAGPNHFNQDFFPTDKSLSDNNMVEHDVEEAFQKTLDEIDALREQGRYEGDPYVEEEENGVKVKKPNPNRKKRRAGLINEILWTCGGLDKALLRMCPTDWAKKAGMGGTILGTAVLASFSGGYAAFTVFESLLIAAITGFIWGLVIFNLDRYLVNSMYSDGEPTISKQEFLSGLPRIIIAIFLGIVISTPIELKIFDGKINDYLDKEKSQYIEKCKERDLAQFNTEDERLKKSYENAEKELKALRSCINAEEKGLIYDRSTGEISKDSSGNPLKNPRGAGNGDEYKELKRNEPILKQKADSLKKVYDSYHVQGDNLVATSKTNAENDFKTQIGLSKKLEAMSEITTSPTSCWYKPWTWTSLAIVRLVISLMFIILEILPVVNKMMQTDGEYDRLIDLESDTRKKLTRIKEFNNILVLIGGNLSPFTNQTLYGKLPDDKNPGLVFEDHEGNKAFAKSDFRKENKNETDSDNHDIYKHAREVCKKYVMTKIDKLFEGTYSKDIDEDFSSSRPQTSGPQPMSSSIDSDPSDDVIKI